MVYAIFCRYEYLSPDGKKFTEYFKTDNTFDSEDKVKERIKELKTLSSSTDKHTKLKHEFKYEYVDETLFPQPKMRRPKGRPKKFTNDELNDYIKILNKCGQARVDDNIRGFLYNDEEAHKYIQEHIKDKSKWARYWYDNDNVLYIILKNNSEKMYE